MGCNTWQVASVDPISLTKTIYGFAIMTVNYQGRDTPSCKVDLVKGKVPFVARWKLPYVALGLLYCVESSAALGVQWVRVSARFKPLRSTRLVQCDSFNATRPTWLIQSGPFNPARSTRLVQLRPRLCYLQNFMVAVDRRSSVVT